MVSSEVEFLMWACAPSNGAAILVIQLLLDEWELAVEE